MDVYVESTLTTQFIEKIQYALSTVPDDSIIKKKHSKFVMEMLLRDIIDKRDSELVNNFAIVAEKEFEFLNTLANDIISVLLVACNVDDEALLCVCSVEITDVCIMVSVRKEQDYEL